MVGTAAGLPNWTCPVLWRPQTSLLTPIPGVLSRRQRGQHNLADGMGQIFGDIFLVCVACAIVFLWDQEVLFYYWFHTSLAPEVVFFFPPQNQGPSHPFAQETCLCLSLLCLPSQKSLEQEQPFGSCPDSG